MTRGLLLLSLPLAASAALAVEITQCGQGVPAHEIGELRMNLHCTAGVDPLHLAQGVLVGRGATLNLNGFTIMGDGTGGGVQCAGCSVNGPGEVTNFGVGITGGGGRVRLQSLVVRGNRNGMTYKAPRIIEPHDVALGHVADRGRGAEFLLDVTLFQDVALVVVEWPHPARQ